MAVAQRMYARALFEAAQEAGRLDGVAADLAAIAAAVEEVPELRGFLRNPQIDPPEKASRARARSPAGADELVRNFVRLVAEKGRAGELPEMNARARGARRARAEPSYRRARRRRTSSRTTRRRRSCDTIEQASGRSVEATRTVDPSLIGGIVLQVGSFRADGSVRGRLERLRTRTGNHTDERRRRSGHAQRPLADARRDT